MHVGLVVLYGVMLALLVLTALGLGGNWILAGLVALLRLVGLGRLGWTDVVVVVGLAALGEAVEAVLGAVVVAGRGGTRWGVVGSFVGGVLGALAGAGVAPPLGSVAGAFVGAFAGAAAGEYLRRPDAGEAIRVGAWAFVGRALATGAKLAAGLGIVAVAVRATW